MCNRNRCPPRQLSAPPASYRSLPMRCWSGRGSALHWWSRGDSRICSTSATSLAPRYLTSRSRCQTCCTRQWSSVTRQWSCLSEMYPPCKSCARGMGQRGCTCLYRGSHTYAWREERWQRRAAHAGVGGGSDGRGPAGAQAVQRGLRYINWNEHNGTTVHGHPPFAHSCSPDSGAPP